MLNQLLPQPAMPNGLPIYHLNLDTPNFAIEDAYLLLDSARAAQITPGARRPVLFVVHGFNEAEAVNEQFAKFLNDHYGHLLPPLQPVVIAVNWDTRSFDENITLLEGGQLAITWTPLTPRHDLPETAKELLLQVIENYTISEAIAREQGELVQKLFHYAAERYGWGAEFNALAYSLGATLLARALQRPRGFHFNRVMLLAPAVDANAVISGGEFDDLSNPNVVRHLAYTYTDPRKGLPDGGLQLRGIAYSPNDALGLQGEFQGGHIVAYEVNRTITLNPLVLFQPLYLMNHTNQNFWEQQQFILQVFPPDGSGFLSEAIGGDGSSNDD